MILNSVARISVLNPHLIIVIVITKNLCFTPKTYKTTVRPQYGLRLI